MKEYWTTLKDGSRVTYAENLCGADWYVVNEYGCMSNERATHEQVIEAQKIRDKERWCENVYNYITKRREK